jgi:diacylglycerol kinase
MGKRRPTRPQESPRPRPTWPTKFACAARGVKLGILGENSFVVHVPAAILVVAVAAWLDVSYTEWLALVIVMTIVITAELLNTAIEHLARAVTEDENAHVRNALDVASGGVLAASLGASVVGVMVLVTGYLARQ